MKKCLWLFALAAIAALAGCGGTPGRAADMAPPAPETPARASETKEAAPEMNITINGKTYAIETEDNAAARALAKRLPLSVTMTELNGNEKYHRLPQALPADDYAPGTIRAGDLMLFGGDCIVLFYKDFSTRYRYTRIGRLKNPDGLAETVGAGDVRAAIAR